MDIELIREFVVLGKTLNFTKASKALNLDQSTLSRHLQSLEKSLAVPLVSRTSRTVALTSEGEIFLGKAIDFLEAFDTAVELIRDTHERNTPTVKLGGVFLGGGIDRLVSFVAAQVQKEQLPVFIELFQPHLSRDPTVLAANEASLSLKREDIDMAVYFPRDDSGWDELDHEPLFRDPFYLVVSEEHPLAELDSVRLDELRPYTLRISNFYNANNEHVIKLCEQRGFTPKTRTKVIGANGQWCVADGPEDMFIFNGSALNTVPPRVLSGLVAIPVTDPDAYFEANAVWRKGDDRPEIGVLLDAMRRACEFVDFGKAF